MNCLYFGEGFNRFCCEECWQAGCSLRVSINNVDALEEKRFSDFVENFRGAAERVKSHLSFLVIAVGKDVDLAKDVSKELGR